MMLNALPPSYCNKMNLLKSKIDNPEISLNEKKKEFDEFLVNYLLLPKFWIQNLQIEFTSRQKTYNKIINRALNEFYSQKVYDSIKNIYIGYREFYKIPFDRVMTKRSFQLFIKRCEILQGRKECEPFIKDFLSFPHSKLKEALESYKEYSGKFVTKDIYETYKKSQAQYNKIMSNENDVEEWLNSVVETEDMRFIIQNVEARIAEEYSKKELWILYITFMKKFNKMAASEIYYRYSRLFLGDSKLKDDFRLLTKKPANNGNKFLQEHKFGSSFLKKYEKHVIPPQSPLHLKVQKLPHQSFTYPVKMIERIIKNASSLTLRKLHCCSKYFYFKSKQSFCHNFILGNSSYYYNDSLHLDETGLNLIKNVKSIKIEGVIAVNYTNHPINRAFLSSVIPHLCCEKVQVLKIRNQTFSVADYEYLTKSGNIKKIVFSHVFVKNEMGKLIDILDVFKNLPNASHIEINSGFTTSFDIWNQLSSLERQATIKYLYLSNRFTYFDNTFINFLLTHCGDNATVYYPFSKTTNFEQTKKDICETSKEIKLYSSLDYNGHCSLFF